MSHAARPTTSSPYTKSALQLKRDIKREAHFLLTSLLWKFWSGWLSRSGGRRRKLEWGIVQLKGRASVECRTLRWLHLDDSLTIWQSDRAFDIPLMVFIDLNATFCIQYLVQAFPRARLLRPFLPTGEQRPWPYSSAYDHEADGDPNHEIIILLTCGLSKRHELLTERLCH